MSRRSVAALAAATVAVFGGPASAQSPEAFFMGKTIKIMVGHSPGGGFDA